MPRLADDPRFHCRWCEGEARAAEKRPRDQAESIADHPWEFEPDEEDIVYECVDTLGPFRRGDCVRLTRLPAGMLEDLDEDERPDFESLVGDTFEIVAMMAPNIVDIARNCRGPNGEEGTGEWGWEVFTMPLELLEPGEWDPEPGT